MNCVVYMAYRQKKAWLCTVINREYSIYFYVHSQERYATLIIKKEMEDPVR